MLLVSVGNVWAADPVDVKNVYFQTQEGKYLCLDTDVNMSSEAYAWNALTLGDNAYRMQSNVNKTLYLNSGSHGYLSQSNSTSNARMFYFYEVKSTSTEAITATLVAQPETGKQYVVGVDNITSAYHGFYVVLGRRCSAAATTSQRLDALQINNSAATAVVVPNEVTINATAATATGTVALNQAIWTLTSGEPEPEPFQPEAGKIYSLKDKISGLYINITKTSDHKKDVIWGTEAEAFSFTSITGGFTIQNLQGKYIGKFADNTWSMDNRTAETWTIEAGENIENEIKLHCAQGYLGADNYVAGQALYRNKSARTYVVEEMTLPTTEVAYTVKFGGETIKTATVTEYIGQAPSFQVGAPSYVTVEGMPTTITAETTAVEVTTSLNEQAPFDMENEYILNFTNTSAQGTFLYWFNDNNSGKLNELRAKEDNVTIESLDEASHWTFGGDWLNGFTLQNVKTGKYVAAGDNYNNGTQLKMGETAEKYELVKFTSGWRLKVNNTFLAHYSANTHIVTYYNPETYAASYITFTKYEAPAPIEPVSKKNVTLTFVMDTSQKVLLNNNNGTLNVINYTANAPASAQFEATLWSNGKYTFVNSEKYLGYQRMDSEFKSNLNYWEVLPLEGVESQYIVGTVPAGSVYLYVENRSGSNVNPGVLMIKTFEPYSFTNTNAPYFNTNYTSAILMEVVGPTGVGTVLRSEATSEAIFNLQGQKVNNIQRGINVVNGKKTVNK